MARGFFQPELSDADWTERARAIIPGGASTGSKRIVSLYGGPGALTPTHFTSAKGCRVVTAGGDELIDCTMALGSVALGYADDVVVAAVTDAIASGNVSALSSVLEVEVAERLCSVIPCAEQVRFLKTGAEGVAAAVRLARAHTGLDHVIGCGYFGWLDWSSNAPGVPAGVQSNFTAVPFDDLEALTAAAKAHAGSLAAIVLEPVIERAPSVEWLAEARRLCDNLGAVLIFDEVKTGFRVRTGGYQELCGVTPDLAVFAKAMANGFPLAAIVGRGSIMGGAERTWISSTLAGESAALAAASAVLDWHERAEVCESLAEIGEEMRSAVARAIESSGLGGVSVEGLPSMWWLRFDSPERAIHFQQTALERGVLFKRGGYNFASLAHDDDALAAIEDAASEACVRLRDAEHA